MQYEKLKKKKNTFLQTEGDQYEAETENFMKELVVLKINSV